MKRVIFFIHFIIGVIGASWAAGVYQLPNSDMELWETKGGGNEPVGWNTFATAGGSMSSFVQSTEQCSKSTEIRSGATGSYCALVRARSVFGVVANGMITTGLIEGGSMSPTSPDNHNITKRGTEFACPFTGRPDSVVAWVKTAPVSTSQKARFFFDFHGNYDTQDPWLSSTPNEVMGIAGANIAYNAAWQRVSVPVYYKGETLTIDGDSKTPNCSDVRPSYCLASIATNYVPGKGNKNDALYIDDFKMIYNSKLKSLTVDGVAVAGFNKDVFSYSVNKNYSDVKVAYASDGRFATITDSYDAASSKLTISVKGDDYEASGNMHTYTIQFSSQPSCDATLTSFKVNGSQIAGFSSTTTSYELEDSYDETKVSYTAVECAETSETWDESTHTLTVTVSSKSGYAAKTNVYTFKFHAAYGSQLKSLKIGDSNVSGFSPSTYNYTVIYAYTPSDLSYVVDDEATAETSYNSSTYVLTITVKGGDYATNKENVHTYTIQYHAPYGSQLTELKLYGTAVAGFSPSTYTYNASSYAYYESQVVYKADADATVEKSFNSSTNVLSLVVKGGDYDYNKNNFHSYTIQFHAPFASVLNSLMVNGTSVNSFSSSRYSYSVKSTYIEGKTSITYTASEGASVEKSYDASSNIYTLVVKAADYDLNNANIHTYKISFHDSYGSQLLEIRNNNVPIEGFASSVYVYTLKETYSASTITYTQDEDATVTTSYDDKTYLMTIVVKGGDYAENSSNTHTYTIQFHAPYGSYLKSLSVNGVSVPRFNFSTLSYSVDDAYEKAVVDYQADDEAIVTQSYDEKNNILSILVKGGDIELNPTNSHTYKIQFHAPYGAKLTTLKLNGTTLQGFAPDVFSYSVTSAYDPSKTKITYLTDEEATATGSFDASTNVYSIVVKGGDFATNPSNTNTYTIEFHDSYGSQLRSLSVGGVALSGFSPSTYNYTLKNAYDPALLTYVSDADATVDVSTDAKNYLVTLKVKGGDYAENPSNIHTYRIQFHAPYASQLTSLSLNGVQVSGFSPNIYDYSVKTTYDAAEILYEASEDAIAIGSYDEASNTYRIVVKGGDLAVNPSNTHTYTIQFHDAYGSQLTSLKVDRVMLDDFSPNKYSYYVNKNYSDVTVSYEVDADATSSESFDSSTNTMTISVYGGDYKSNPANVHTYTIRFCASSYLSALMIDGTSISNFRPTKYAYTLSSVVYENVKVSYKASEGADVESYYDAESSLLTLTVKGSDIDIFPTNYHTYTVQFHTSYASKLTEIKVNGELIDGFSRDMFNYVVRGSYEDYTVTYSADVDAKAKATYNESTCRLSIVVTGGDYADNPSNTHTYMIQFYAPSKLVTLKADGASVSGFNPSVYTYSLDDKSYEETKLVYYADENAHLETSYDPETYSFVIVVKGKDIETFTDNYHTYTLQFSHPFESQLVDLSVDGSTIASFDRDKYSYIYDAVYANVNVVATADAGATVTMTYNENDYVLTILVEGGNIARNPSNYHVYRIEFNDPFTYYSQLKSISVNGVVLSDFNRDVYEYYVDGSLSNMTVSYVADEKATVSESYDSKTNALRLVVNAGNIEKDPTNTHTYVLKFTAQFSFESWLTALSLGGESVASFEKEKYDYSINASYNPVDIAFTVSPLAQYCADYDKESGVLTIVVWGGDFKENSSNFHTYKLKYVK